MGEGGGIVTNDERLQSTMRGFRNWGRYCASPDCCIRSVNPNAFCPRTRLTKDCELPDDYMVNYQYEWMGYNLKPLEIQSAILIEQMKRMKTFDKTRKKNYNRLYEFFQTVDRGIKTWKINKDVSPFSFPVLLPPDEKFRRKHMIDHLRRDKIECRVLFGGNLMKHPAYYNKKHLWDSYGNFDNSDALLERFLMLGVSQVNTEEDIDKVISSLKDFFIRW
jgi:CDP-6-deoxy-D-xylo-4-hexulose-3-dehydrase